MHVIVHTIPVKPGSVEEAKSLFEEKVPPLAEHFSGWRGARLCATGDNNLVTIGRWADEEQMKQFLAQPEFEQAMGSFAHLFSGAPATYIAEEVTSVGPAAE